jgi:hypothetical protein
MKQRLADRCPAYAELRHKLAFRLQLRTSHQFPIAYPLLEDIDDLLKKTGSLELNGHWYT